MHVPQSEGVPRRQTSSSNPNLQRSLRGKVMGRFLLFFVPGLWECVEIDGKPHWVPDLKLQVISDGINGIRMPAVPGGDPDYTLWKVNIQKAGGIVLDAPEIEEQYLRRTQVRSNGALYYHYHLVGFGLVASGRELVVRRLDDTYDRWRFSLCGRYGIPMGPDNETKQSVSKGVEQHMHQVKAAQKLGAPENLAQEAEARLKTVQAPAEEPKAPEPQDLGQVAAKDAEIAALQAKLEAEAAERARTDAELEKLKKEVNARKPAARRPRKKKEQPNGEDAPASDTTEENQGGEPKE